MSISPETRAPALEDSFVLEGELGRGGFGVVHRARSRTDGRAVAVKISHDDLGTGEADRVQREAAILAGIDHPNLARFHGVYHGAGGRLALVYEYIEGEALDALLRRTQLPPARAVPILAQLARGLDHLHAQGLIHRDLKCENVMVGPGDHVTLLDFGLARPETPGATLTADGVILGTPATMAPELFEGAPATQASDRYAFGCVAYQVLVGSPPFPEALAEVLAAQAAGPPPRPSAAQAAVPPAMDAAVLGLLARDPEARPQAAAPVAEALGEALAAADGEVAVTVVRDRPQLLRPSLVDPRRPAPRSSRRPALAAAAAISVGVLAGLLWEDAPPPPPPPVLAPSFPERYAAALARIEELHIVGNDLVPPERARESGRRALRAVRNPSLWGRLHRQIGAPLEELEAWMEGGRELAELPPATLEALRREEARFAAENRPGVPPPLYPLLDLEPAAELVEAPRESGRLELMRSHRPWIDAEVLAPRAGWRGAAYAAARESIRQNRRFVHAWQDPSEAAALGIEFPVLPSHHVARTLDIRPGFSGYLERVWNLGADAYARLQLARLVLPATRAAHRALYAMGRALAEAPPSERDHLAEVFFFLCFDLGEVANESYLATLRPEQILVPVRDTPHWHVLAGAHSDRLRDRDRGGPWPTEMAHLERALELAGPDGVAASLRFLVQERLITAYLRYDELARPGVPGRILELFRQGHAEEWARYVPMTYVYLLRSLHESPDALPWTGADLRRLAELEQAAWVPGDLRWPSLEEYLPSQEERAALRSRLAAVAP